MRDQILQALKQHAEGQIIKHKTNVDIYLNSTTGIGEHSDIVETIEKEIKIIGGYKEQLEVIEKYFEN